MERLDTFQDAHAKVLVNAQRCMEKIRQLSARTFDTAEGGVRILQALRRETYEDLNQIQHEHTIVRAAQWLIAQEKCSQRTQWFWNPRQTGDATEPDLRGLEDGDVVVSAEITTSQNPVGVIDSRMRNTLAKLAEAEGAKQVRKIILTGHVSTKSGWTGRRTFAMRPCSISCANVR
jgi:hypothetical protein